MRYAILLPLLFAGCIRGSELIPPKAVLPVSQLIADGAHVTAFESGDYATYHAPSGVVTIPSWSTGAERVFLTLHEVCHGWFATHDWSSAPAGVTDEHAADLCALHYMRLDAIPIPADRRDDGYLVGSVAAEWLAWADGLLP